MRRSMISLMALSALAAATGAHAAINNGDFEAALAGWSTYTSTGADPYSAMGSVGTPLSQAPDGGTTMAVVHAGAVGDYQRLWQDFAVVGSNASMSMSVLWNGNDYIDYDANYNDDGYARIAKLDQNGAPLGWTTLWTGSVAQYGNADGPNHGASPWTTASYNFASTGTYRIEFGVRNVLDDLDDQSSEVFVDNVALVDPADPVPEPGEWAMMTLGLGIVGAFGRRRASR